jgi:squalene synthase HpnC
MTPTPDDGAARSSSETLETPSGKDVGYENFPVGSFLLSPSVRPHVTVFYAFARAIDDIADNPALAPADKVARLDRFDRAVLGAEPDDPALAKAHAMRRTLNETGINVQHCRDLIAAFKQDAVKGRYASWDELMAYCTLSAAPIGRFLLDLHGGSRDGYGPADALCNALQVINHLQDCRDDYLTLDRVYLPLDLVTEEGGLIESLAERRTPAALRRVIDRCLEGCAGLLDEARALPRGLRSRRLAMESAAILDIATTLVQRLRRGDPLAGRVQLSKTDYFVCCARGAASALL